MKVFRVCFCLLLGISLILSVGVAQADSEENSSRIQSLEIRVDNLEIQTQNPDADTLDGFDSSDFAFSNHTHTEYGVLSIPFASFKPRFSEESEYIAGAGLIQNRLFYDHFVAPVSLPHNATITSFTGHMRDYSTTAYMQLQLRGQLYGIDTTYFLASVGTGISSAPGYISVTDYSVMSPLVDNLNSQYWVYLYLPNSGGTPAPTIALQGVTIEYEVTR